MYEPCNVSSARIMFRTSTNLHQVTGTPTRDSHGLPRRVAKRRCRGKAPWGAPSFSQHLRDHPREVYPGTASIKYRTNYMDGLWRLYNFGSTSYIIILYTHNIIIQYDSSWYTQIVFHIIQLYMQTCVIRRGAGLSLPECPPSRRYHLPRASWKWHKNMLGTFGNSV